MGQAGEADIRIGISGWRYAAWRGTFYPPKLPQRRELEYASSKMRSIEINGSFYSLQRPESYAAWRDQTPDDFVFSVKGGRFITHNKKLRDCEGALANFFASGVLALGEKLGPFLWQLPPQLSYDPKRLEDFFAILPRTTSQAAALASRPDPRFKREPYTEFGDDRPLRHTLEVRHDTYLHPGFPELLRKHDIALCIADTAGKWPLLHEVTSDFVYVRLHGDKELYVSGYAPRTLDMWARHIESWKPRDVYVYFDNDVKVRAPYDAMNLASRFGQNPPVKFPRKQLRAIEKVRGVEVPLTSWHQWKKTSRVALPDA
ncbi:MAG: hypothetical protein JWP97_393 [Labilithrix sp.]|nr:hypothetical protein [Labilithrix sp.]